MSILNPEDIKDVEARGSSLESVEKQIENFKKGFPWMKIVAPATPERGILSLTPEQQQEAVNYYENAEVNGKCKFVPASGAASRMFKDIFSGLSSLQDGTDPGADSPVGKLSENIRSFAFYDEDKFGIPENSKEYREKAARMLLTDEGLGYGSKPKGVLKFHRYDDGEVRTSIAEHLVEAQNYMRNPDGTASLVISVSPEHRQLFEAAIAEVKQAYEEKYGIKYEISFTYQDKATDTIAVDTENNPFRKDDGTLLFRPAGHGALIYNLNNLDAELVSIKNIDNVSNERFLPLVSQFKKVLMGKCLELRDKIFAYLKALDSFEEPCSPSCKQLCDEIETFLDNELCIKLPASASCAERVALLRSKLDRPIRVCGMVRNLGEPGGGPFIICGKDGSTNLQILESVQINPSDPQSADIMKRSTHFNPVDIVCCLHNYKGEKFDLLKYVDDEAGFISSKSYEGRELKALELPGLWNGAMSSWNTLFVEVPVDTFNPVKVVLDLLRPAHQ